MRWPFVYYKMCIQNKLSMLFGHFKLHYWTRICHPDKCNHNRNLDMNIILRSRTSFKSFTWQSICMRFTHFSELSQLRLSQQVNCKTKACDHEAWLNVKIWRRLFEITTTRQLNKQLVLKTKLQFCVNKKPENEWKKNEQRPIKWLLLNQLVLSDKASVQLLKINL